MKKIILFLVLLTVYFTLSATSVQYETQKILASDGAAGDNLGKSVSIDGDYSIVGANGDDFNGDNSGSAYIYYNNGTNWVEQQKLTASDSNNGDEFGSAVAISGNYAIIGSSYDDDNGENSGSAYIFFNNGTNWVEQQKLTASDSNNGDEFGSAVAISGNYAIIGSSYDDDNGENSGSAYIFFNNGTSWVEQQKLTASDGTVGDDFGFSVSISGNYALIGSNYDDYNGEHSGSAYVFYNNGNSWVEQQKLTASDGAANDDFGFSVSISNSLAIVGAPAATFITGAAYVFYYNGVTWVEQQKLTASDGEGFDCFGISTSIYNNYAIAGAHSPMNTIKSSSAYIFHYDGSYWIEQQKLITSDGIPQDDFGYSVSISDSISVIGASHDDDNGGWSGSAYIFDLTEDNSLPVTLSSFDAIRTNSNFVELNWITKSETDMSGYNLLRAENNSLNGALKVNTAIITASNLACEHNYKFTDEEVELDNTYYYWLESIAMSGNVEYYGPVTVSLDKEKPEEYTNLGIMGIYPNPFNPETNIDYSVKEETPVEISVYNIKGQRVKTLVDKSVSAGDHNVAWHGDSDSDTPVSSGVYFVKMITGNHIETRKIVLMK